LDCRCSTAVRDIGPTGTSDKVINQVRYIVLAAFRFPQHELRNTRPRRDQEALDTGFTRPGSQIGLQLAPTDAQTCARPGPSTGVRSPKVYNVRTDPYERADITSNTYRDWMIKRTWVVIYGKAVAKRLLDTFTQFPPRQPTASFTTDRRLNSPTTSSPPEADNDVDPLISQSHWRAVIRTRGSR
jgi:hypothetical protein